MSIVRRLARPMLAATFIDTGLSSLRDPQSRVEQVRPLVDRVAGPLRLPTDPQTFLRVDGAVMVTAGGLLALGRMPRLSALALVTAAAPATYTEIARWREKDPEQRRARRAQVLARLGLIGGALLAAVDTSGRPGLAWRGRHAVEHVHHSAAAATGGAALAAERVNRKARKTGHMARKTRHMARKTRQATEQTRTAGSEAGRRMRQTAGALR